MTMRYGFALPGGTASQQVELAEVAERSGWDGVFVWEAACGVDAWSLLAAMAMRTSRVRLGTLLTPLPWRRPWKVAGQLFTVDELSGGRAILSVGLGAVDPQLGSTGEVTDRRHRAELLDESLDVIDAIFDGRRTYQGKHYTLDLSAAGMYRWPDRPRPPVWIVGMWGASKSMRRVLRGDGYLPNLPGGPAAEVLPQVADMRSWLDGNAPEGRSIDLVCEGQTPDDDPAAAAAVVAPYARAGATWWIESRWSSTPHDEPALAAVRRRLQAGPPHLV